MTDIARIDRLQVTNFQSLAEADIELGGLTVIVGPSNSGKSALLRALKAAVRNVTSPSAVRVGCTTFTSQITFNGTSVSIERGKSQSTYRVILPDGSEDVFTKSGRTVPVEIQNLLQLVEPEGPDLTFSSQIDPPFLLSETGTVAAKMLGDLTNVSKLHAAAKEANRRRLEASRLADLRKRDALGAMTRMKDEFGDIREQGATLKNARASFNAVRASVATAERVEGLLSDLALVESSEADLRSRLEELPVPADVETLAERAGELMGVQAVIVDLLTDLSDTVQQQNALAGSVVSYDSEVENLETEFHDLLQEAGECPLCGSKVEAA